jgi:hypothetical protein
LIFPKEKPYCRQEDVMGAHVLEYSTFTVGEFADAIMSAVGNTSRDGKMRILRFRSGTVSAAMCVEPGPDAGNFEVDFAINEFTPDIRLITSRAAAAVEGQPVWLLGVTGLWRDRQGSAVSIHTV